MKLMVIASHLSTGGMPQYLYKYLQTFKNRYDKIILIEFTNFSSVYVVQKKKIIDLIGKENVITLGDYSDWTNEEEYIKKRKKIIQIIEEFSPDVIYMAEAPESYDYKCPPKEVSDYIYREDRPYIILESNHNNYFDLSKVKYIPDKFILCSSLQLSQVQGFNYELWEYPIENLKRPDRKKTLESIGLDPNSLHVLNVGLINKNKNQKYIFDLAKDMLGSNVIFHFVGNSCFMEESGISREDINLQNCKSWGERDDVDKFMSCMDIFLFPSIRELNPISLKEALSWGMDVISNRYENYDGQYSDIDNFHLMDEINVKEFITLKEKNIHKITPTSLDGKFLIVCSFYNNNRDHILNTIHNIIKQTHKNWVLILGDDFSTNDCKKILQEEIKKINHPSILYYDIKYKRELYLYQNFFKTIKYDYYFDLDSDDIIDRKILEIYNYHFNKYPNVSSIFCDYEVVSENDSLERISTVKMSPNLNLVEDFYRRIKLSYYEIWEFYHSWNMYGAARCFRKNNNKSFLIYKNCKTSTDSFFLFSSLYYGDHLNIPRNLYKSINRKNSDSSEMPIEEYNDYNINALESIDRYKKDNKKFKSICYYDDVWLETNALSFSEITKKNNNINLITDINNNQVNKINELYFDKKITINSINENNLIIIWNKLNKKQKIEIIQILKDDKFDFTIYYFLDNFSINEKEIENYFKNEKDIFFNMLNKDIKNFYFFYYFRHIFASKSKQI